jgi:hypothetical protein
VSNSDDCKPTTIYLIPAFQGTSEPNPKTANRKHPRVKRENGTADRDVMTGGKRKPAEAHARRDLKDRDSDWKSWLKAGLHLSICPWIGGAIFLAGIMMTFEGVTNIQGGREMAFKCV